MSEETRLLLVEDDDDVRLTLAANLALDGFTIIEAESGERALALLDETRPDVVLSDVLMAGMTGVDMLVELRARVPELPVVLTTAFSSDDLLRRALLAGVFTVLPKPFEPARAARALRRAAGNPSVLILDEILRTSEALATALQSSRMRIRPARDLDEAMALATTTGSDVMLVRIDDARRAEASQLPNGSPLSVIAVDNSKAIDPVFVLRAIASARAEARV